MKQLFQEPSETVLSVPAGGVFLEASLTVPENAHAIILFAHGSGSSRHSPRNRHVAAELQDGGLATLLLDLLTPDEEIVDIQATRLRFDVAFLSERLLHAIDWILTRNITRHLRVGLFGSSTGAAAALMTAAMRPEQVGAVVSRGGRPDLASSALLEVRAPTLLIVGGNDRPVIELNRQAFTTLTCGKKMEIVPRANHLFEEPGALEEVSRLATAWFHSHLNP